ncbi:MAG TPA: outer membrane protein transport protein [Polyangia bacterium]|nr:outer membrane protein transport protein [Polyangia bacterium]
MRLHRAQFLALAGIVPLVVITSLSSLARASGFAAARFGGEHGNVTTDNPTALWFNPAGIGFSEGTQLFLDGTLAMRHATYEHSMAPTDMPEPPGAQGASFGKATLFNVFGGPMAGATTRVGRLAFGLGLMVPFGGRAHWGTNDKFKNDPMFPLAADGIQRWQNIEGALTFIYFSGAMAYRLGPVSVGVTGSLVRSSVYSSQAKNPVGNGDPDLTHEGRAVIDVSGYQPSIGLGIMVEAIANRLWLGVGYQSQPGFGPMTLHGTLRITYKDSDAPLNVDFHQALPDSLRAGARFRPIPTLELRLSGEYMRWSVMQSQCVSLRNDPCLVDTAGADATPMGTTIQNLRRYWKDTYGVRAGASGWLSPGTELFGGVGFETAATPDSTLEAGLPDAANFAASLGARFRVLPTLFVAASYTHIQYLDRDNTGKSQLAQAELPTRLPDAGGKYTAWIGILNVNLQKQF